MSCEDIFFLLIVLIDILYQVREFFGIAFSNKIYEYVFSQSEPRPFKKKNNMIKKIMYMKSIKQNKKKLILFNILTLAVLKYEINMETYGQKTHRHTISLHCGSFNSQVYTEPYVFRRPPGVPSVHPCALSSGFQVLP